MDSCLLYLENLWVGIDDKVVVKGINLCVRRNELHIIMGPNAAGKSSLLAAIAGLRRYKVIKGRILLEGRDITKLKPYERARLGIALAHQIPPQVRGVKVSELINELVKVYNHSNEYVDELIKMLKIRDFLGRDLFVGMSGGERKRLELLITLLQKPKVALLDEPDSGVDIDSLKMISEAIRLCKVNTSSIILVTHTGHILNMLRGIADTEKAHVMIEGRVVYSDTLTKVLNIIMKYGYSYFKG